MTDREHRAQIARIQSLTKKWATPLGLRWWKATFVYSREPLKSDAPEGRTCVAQTMVDWEYLNATITFDTQAAEAQSDEELEDTFVHECCHILVNEMRMWAESEIPQGKRDEAMHHEERVVTQISKAFIWTMQAGLAEGKKTAVTRKRKKVKK